MSGTAGRRCESLRAIPLFSGLRDDDLEQIARILIERRFPRNKTIVERACPATTCTCMREGRVKVTKLSEDGREKILEFLEAGHLLRRDGAARRRAALGVR